MTFSVLLGLVLLQWFPWLVSVLCMVTVSLDLLGHSSDGQRRFNITDYADPGSPDMVASIESMGQPLWKSIRPQY